MSFRWYDWEELIDELFGKDTFNPRYKSACKDKNFDEAKKAAEEDNFVDHSYLFNFTGVCDCELEGCTLSLKECWENIDVIPWDNYSNLCECGLIKN
jgi:hypothetical protein